MRRSHSLNSECVCFSVFHVICFVMFMSVCVCYLLSFQFLLLLLLNIGLVNAFNQTFFSCLSRSGWFFYGISYHGPLEGLVYTPVWQFDKIILTQSLLISFFSELSHFRVFRRCWNLKKKQKNWTLSYYNRSRSREKFHITTLIWVFNILLLHF